MAKQKTDASRKRLAKGGHIARATWLALAVLCLAYSEYVVNLNEADAYKAADTVLLLAMFVLTFPAGYIGIGITMLYSFIFLTDRPDGPWDLVIMWLPFVALGYWQWFIFVPWLFRKLFRRDRQVMGRS